MKLAFRITKNNKNSFLPLFSSIKRVFRDAEIYLVKSEEEIISGDFDILFYSFMSPDLSWIKQELANIKNKDICLVAGGAHTSADPEGVLNMGFDSVVVGEGEKSIVSLIKDYRNGNLKPLYHSYVSFIDYSFSDSLYTSAVEIVRGCVHRCKFCQVPYLFKGVKYRSIASVLREARILLERKRSFIRFIAPNSLSYLSYDGVTPNIKALERLFSGLKDIGIKEIFFGSFPSEVRPESVVPEAVKLMARFCANKRVVMGIQSGSEERLFKLNRGHTLSQVLNAINILNNFGFYVEADFIFGFPNETDKERKETLNFIYYILSHFQVYIHAHTYMPLPGTPLASQKPSSLPKWFRAKLHELEREGLLRGFWQKQEKIGEHLWKERAHL